MVMSGIFVNSGYPHDDRADKNPYPYDRRADKDSYLYFTFLIRTTAIISALSKVTAILRDD